MIKKAGIAFYNCIRFTGKKYWKKLLRVAPSTHIVVSKNATFSVGKRFSARRNVEINVRGSAKLEICDNVFINSGCVLTAREHISIGNGTILGPGVMIFDNDHKVIDGKIADNAFDTAPIIIGNNVWIGAGAIILKGSVIGNNCIIAAGSVVKGEIMDNTIMVQKRNSTHIPVIREEGLEKSDAENKSIG